jgi:hypothetical protein
VSQEQRIQQELFDEVHQHYLAKEQAMLLDVTGGWHGEWIELEGGGGLVRRCMGCGVHDIHVTVALACHEKCVLPMYVRC